MTIDETDDGDTFPVTVDLRPFNKRAKELAERLENAMNHGEPRAVFLREVVDFLYSLKDLRP